MAADYQNHDPDVEADYYYDDATVDRTDFLL